MKIKIVLLSLCLLALSMVGHAQAEKTTAAAGPGLVVKNLYTAQKLEKTNPFAQIKSRVLVDKYFTKEFADLIWKTNSSDTGWNVDPLYNAQDPQITGFVVGQPKEDGSPDIVYLKVTFKNFGKANSVGFKLRREAGKVWKIDNIEYSDGEDLSSILQYSTDPEFQKGHDEGHTFKGEYMVGSKLCDVTPTMNGMFYRVFCEGKDGFGLYAVDGNENETGYYRNDGKPNVIDKFVFKNGSEDGKFIDASGKEFKVTRAPKRSDGPENEPVSGELQLGKNGSVILYVGEETGDYAAYCFANDSEAGRAIMAVCKDKDVCEIKATLGEGSCKVPGLEAGLSASFRILNVASARSLGRRK